jgi:salicylate hydroxylase
VSFEHNTLLKVAVIGAGVSGLSVASLLAAAGHKVSVFEKNQKIREIGAGIQISPNGFCVLKELGLSENIFKNSVHNNSILICDYHKGKKLLQFDQRSVLGNKDFRLMHRADLVKILYRSALSNKVTFNLGYDADAKSLSNQYSFVIAADGVHSKTRALLNPIKRKNRRSDYFAWRSIVPNKIKHHNGVRLTVAPNKHVVSYPIRGRDQLNLVLIQEAENNEIFEWGMTERPEEIKRLFSGFGGDLKEALDSIETAHKWGLSSHEVPVNWATGNVFLIGDALHPMLPFLAQGANSALEDAFVLAKLITLLDPSEAADKYHEIRKPRLSRLMKQIKNNAWKFHLEHSFFRACTHSGLRFLDKSFPQSASLPFRWLYNYDVTKLNI